MVMPTRVIVLLDTMVVTVLRLSFRRVKSVKSVMPMEMVLVPVLVWEEQTLNVPLDLNWILGIIRLSLIAVSMLTQILQKLETQLLGPLLLRQILG